MSEDEQAVAAELKAVLKDGDVVRVEDGHVTVTRPGMNIASYVTDCPYRLPFDWRPAVPKPTEDE